MKSQMVVTGARKKSGVAARVAAPSRDHGLAYFDFSRVVYIKGELQKKGVALVTQLFAFASLFRKSIEITDSYVNLNGGSGNRL